MTERDVSLILRALGTVEGEFKGLKAEMGEMRADVKEVRNYSFAIKSALDGRIIDANRRIDDEKTARIATEREVARAKEEFTAALNSHTASDAALAADVKKIKRWVIVAGVAGFVVIAAYAPEHIPKIIQGVIGIL